MREPNVLFKKPGVKLDLPLKNNLIAKNFDLLEKNIEFSKEPKLIK